MDVNFNAKEEIEVVTDTEMYPSNEGDVEHRTVEQLVALRAKQAEVTEMYTPLLRKSVRQLRRAERAFLLASDTGIGVERESDALRNLFFAQNVAQFYRHTLLDIEYAYKLSDLRIHEDVED